MLLPQISAIAVMDSSPSAPREEKMEVNVKEAGSGGGGEEDAAARVEDFLFMLIEDLGAVFLAEDGSG